MASIYDWSSTASSNGNADSDMTWAEGQAPSSVNNSARVLVKRVADLLKDLGGVASAGGTANALTLTAANAFTAYADGLIVTLRATATNTAAATLNVNLIGNKPVVVIGSGGEAALAGSEIQSGGIYEFIYSEALNGASGAWLLMNPSSSSVPTGATLDYAGSTAPTGYLMCYGQAVSRSSYAALFAAIGTTHGAGDGSTTFNLPDLRGRVAAGKDDMGGTAAGRLSSSVSGSTLGANGGAETHTLTTGEMPAHTHSVTGSTNATGNHTHELQRYGGGGGTGANIAGGASFVGDTSGAVTYAGNHSHTVTGTAASAGSGNAHTNTQPTIVLNKIIKT